MVIKFIRLAVLNADLKASKLSGEAASSPKSHKTAQVLREDSSHIRLITLRVNLRVFVCSSQIVLSSRKFPVKFLRSSVEGFRLQGFRHFRDLSWKFKSASLELNSSLAAPSSELLVVLVGNICSYKHRSY